MVAVAILPDDARAAAGARLLDQRLGREAGIDEVVPLGAGRQLDDLGAAERACGGVAAGDRVAAPARRALAQSDDAGVEGRAEAIACGGGEIDREEEIVAGGEAAVGIEAPAEGGDDGGARAGGPDRQPARPDGDSAEVEAGREGSKPGPRILDEQGAAGVQSDSVGLDIAARDVAAAIVEQIGIAPWIIGIEPN